MKANSKYLAQLLVIKPSIPGMDNIRTLLISLISFWLILFFTVKPAQAQDPAFTQFFYNPMYYNPALAGTSDGMVIRTNYRNFWRKMDQGFNTMNLTIDSEEPFVSGGLGIIALNGIEGNGVIKSQMLGLAYSYNLLVVPRRMEIQMGLQGAYVLKSLKTSNLIFSDQLDAIYGVTGSTQYGASGLEQVHYPDFSTGFNIRSNLGQFRGGRAMTTFNTGFAMHHITRPNESFTGLEARVPIKYVAYSTGIIRVQSIFMKNFYFMPGLIYEQQGNFKTMVIGTNVRYNPVIFGLWFRNTGLNFDANNIKALSINAGIELGDFTNLGLRINYSYDINVSRYHNLLGDAHEISVSMALPEYGFLPNTNLLSRKARQNRACYNKF
jgi:type IX secretion system PorP/SprF family membrane protein